nr:immunoglobulin light chain junction region [Macaca mulatta]MOW31071.1 immunoglobulin light chain junction region [Macaca mulatta]MOW31081.1 immunoglobulin light chain junction region [Macaca mulatta]MOW31243.1 immunoglobulin light chain junction region [Macaca mulatta]MOW31318.1 immunoglobulin light chain junction region [Macaca mulatta]
DYYCQTSTTAIHVF